MRESLADLSARMQPIKPGMGRTMWHTMFASLILDMLKERETLSLDDLRDRLRKRLEDTNDPLLKEAAYECLDQLAARTGRA